MSKTPPKRDDRRDLVSKILQHQDLDSLLRLSVVLCDLELGGDGCSLFLQHGELNDLELKESTRLTPSLGQRLRLDPDRERAAADAIRDLLDVHKTKPEDLNRTLTRSQVEEWDPELERRLHRFGLTRWAFQFRCPLVIEKITQDVRWSGFEVESSAPLRDHTGTELAGSARLGLCELAQNEIGSIAITTLVGNVTDGIPRGILRVVRNKSRRALGERELEWMTWLSEQVDRCRRRAVSLTDLMDVGAKLEVGDFGDSLVRLLRRVLRARGCSIFLELEPADNNVRTFQCIATTGVFRDGRRVDKEQARYRVNMGEEKTTSFTGWVLRHGQLLAVPSSYDFDPARFPGLVREPGLGKFSESDPADTEPPGGPILICPLFLHQGREVTGAIRLVRPREKGQDFKVHEQLLFLDISRRLSKVLTNLNLRQVSEGLIEMYNEPEAMLRRVPPEVCRLLGVEGCSVLCVRGGRYLDLAATKGLLEGQEGKIIYDFLGEEARGWTGWVAYEKKALRLNSPADATKLKPPPKHSPQHMHMPCEVAVRAHRFLAVPILRAPEDPGSELLGVIRVPRKEEDPPFEEVHQSILVSFAARLSLALSLAHRTNTLKAVTELANPGGLLAEPRVANKQDPTNIAQEVVERAVNLLIDKVGFAGAAVYQLDQRTAEPRLRHSRSSQGGDAEPQMDQAAGRHVFPVRLGTINVGTIAYLTHENEPVTDRQKALVGLLAGICASALYNEAVVDKLKDIRQGLVQVGQEMTGDSRLPVKLQKIAKVAADVTLADNVIIHEYLAPTPGEEVTAGRFRESACGGPVEPSEWKETNFTPDAVPFKLVLSKESVFAPVAEESSVIFHSKTGPNFIQREGISSVAALPLNVSDTCVGCIFFNYRAQQDFTPQRRQEIRMMAEYAAVAIYQGRLLEETRLLLQEKSNLLRYADHSLAQPLNALLGYLGNLAEGVYHHRLQAQNLTSSDAFKASQLARDAGQQYSLCKYVTYLVDTFLRIDREETKRFVEIEPNSEGSLSTVCQHAVEVAEAYLGGAIARTIAPDVIGYFDQNAIRIAVMNVLVNAIKYGLGTGHDRRSKPIALRLAADHRDGAAWATIWVDDSGPGIPESERTSIFERGYRREPSAPGLGIGLFLAREYVTAHGGTIHVEDSDLLGGARFVIALPLNAAEETNR